ncbi:polysaccharide lyase family 7 protein [Algivirga pacifica]|uniref:F5/8 type C domain-containing protein n=1 Tax=Algivirga pacifica TaxID=1162670 RepID=A0ABP9DKQ1_9BACT
MNTHNICQAVAILLLALTNFACTKQASTHAPLSPLPNNTYQSSARVAQNLSNPGFESDWSGWSDTDPSAISSDAYAGTKSAKITGASGKAVQSATVQANTSYELSAYIKGKGKIGATLNGTTYENVGDHSDWSKVSVTFETGSATTVDIFAAYGGGEGRFDAFELYEVGTVDTPPTSTTLSIASATASIDDGNVASNVLDGDLNTRWSGNGDGAYITLDLGSVDTVSSLDIAWYKGNERSSYFDILLGSSTSNLSQVYTGSSSGNTLDPESYDFTSTPARYIRIVGHGNSSNTWNSITEVTAYGNNGDDVPNNGGNEVYPTDIIPSLVDWKITLPVDANGDDSADAPNVDSRNKNAHEVKDANLIDYTYTPYFYAANGEVYFRGHCAGATTSGSKYPRSELRQRVGGGDNYWSVNDYQYLQTELRVTHLPVEKPEVSMVQIHGPVDEPLRVQYHANQGVYIIWNETNKDTANALDYSLGERLRVTVTVDNGDITCLIENLDRSTSYSKTWASSDATGYFKVGCYTQSSIFLSEFKTGYNNEPLDAYGEIAVKSITLTETY